MSPDGPEASGLDDALFGEDTAPNPVVRLPGTTDRDDALDDALFGAEPSGAGPTGVRADNDPSVAAALFGADAAAPPPPHADDGAWVAAAAAAGPAADTSLFDDVPGGVGAGATVRRAPIDRGPRRGAGAWSRPSPRCWCSGWGAWPTRCWRRETTVRGTPR